MAASLDVIPFVLWRGIHLRLYAGLLLIACTAFAAEKVSAPELIRMSKSKASGFRQALVASLKPTSPGTIASRTRTIRGPLSWPIVVPL